MGNMQTAPRWSGIRYISVAQQLNAQAVDWVCERAGRPEDTAPFIVQNRELWLRFNPEARKRLTLFPFVIVTVHFTDGVWWSAPVAQSSRPVSQLAQDLTLETLLFARQAALEDLHVAQLVLGMTPSVAQCVAALSLPQVRAIASQHASELEMLWKQHPGFWRELLTACIGADEEALKDLRRQAKRLFCGALI